MHLKQALITTAFGAVVIASPLDVNTRSVPQKADHYSVINLDDFDLKANNGTLDKRQWRWCVDNGNQGKTNKQILQGTRRSNCAITSDFTCSSRDMRQHRCCHYQHHRGDCEWYQSTLQCQRLQLP
jgi:hypothetical protein